MKRLTVADIASRTGATLRSVRLWTDEVVLFADSETRQAGRGVHRTYPINEVYVAAVAKVLFDQGMKLATIARLGALVRSCFYQLETDEQDNDGMPAYTAEIASALKSAMKGEGPVFFVYHLPAPDSGEQRAARTEGLSSAWIIPKNGEISFSPFRLVRPENLVKGALFGMIEVSSIFAGLD